FLEEGLSNLCKPLVYPVVAGGEIGFFTWGVVLMKKDVFNNSSLLNVLHSMRRGRELTNIIDFNGTSFYAEIGNVTNLTTLLLLGLHVEMDCPFSLHVAT
ncbi:hypothetical protein L9F63_018030, partial [Diploptera punctata]